MRLFVAVALPDEVRRRLGRHIASVARDLPAAKWVRSEALHVTLAFLGEVEPARVEELAAALERAASARPPFAARIVGAGAFPPRGGARVLWLGLEPAAPFEALAGAAREAIADSGLACDEKPFRAHLTVARCRTPWPARDRERAVAALAPPEPLVLDVASLSLVESRLGPAGAVYSTRSESPLGGGS